VRSTLRISAAAFPRITGFTPTRLTLCAGKFADARDARFPKTPRWRLLKKNLDFGPFSNLDREWRPR